MPINLCKTRLSPCINYLTMYKHVFASVYTCMYMYIHVNEFCLPCMYNYTHLSVYKHVHAFVSVYTYACKCVCLLVQMCMNYIRLIHTCTFPLLRSFLYIHVYIYMYIYMCIYNFCFGNVTGCTWAVGVMNLISSEATTAQCSQGLLT